MLTYLTILTLGVLPIAGFYVGHRAATRGALPSGPRCVDTQAAAGEEPRSRASEAHERTSPGEIMKGTPPPLSEGDR